MSVAEATATAAIDRAGTTRGSGATLPSKLRIVSYNVQVGVDTRQLSDYLKHSWKHVLPHRNRLLNLNRIAEVLQHSDMVALQEVDAGSLRSGFIDLTEYLAQRAGFPYWYNQVNRNIGSLAQHSNGFLSRYRPSHATEVRLPRGPGRGAMLFEFGSSRDALRVCSLHLALSRWARRRQLDFIAELVGDFPHLILMGDLNAGCESNDVRRLMANTGLRDSGCDQATFPSWRPIRKIDHILVSEGLRITESRVLDYPLSDHLPVSVVLELPDAVLAG